MVDLKFPDLLYVAHYDHSTDDTPSLHACLTQVDAITVDDETDQPSDVAEYKLVRVRRLIRKVQEIERPL